MRRIGAIAGGLLGALAVASGAYAADPPLRPIPGPAPSPYSELASGWYLRFDVGYRANKGGPSGGPSGFQAVNNESYSMNWDATFGFGLKYQFLRADLTYDRGTAMRVSLNTSTPGAVQPQISAKIRPETVLSNLYIDMGTWAGFTPYVGAGVGFSRLTTNNLYDTNPALNAGIPVQVRTVNFAWAAMAGVGVQLSPRWMLDFGYRYTNYGDAQNFNGVATQGIYQPPFKDLASHEGRIGVRFLLD